MIHGTRQPSLLISINEAVAKAQGFCAYQERSQHEVRLKLYDLGLFSDKVEQVVAQLIQDNFLNEERFAIAYTMGKFRIKKWGRAKIKQGLRLKRVPDKLISKALAQINDDEYINTLKELLVKKEAVLGQKEKLKLNYKLTFYALSKGYERDLITDLLKSK